MTMTIDADGTHVAASGTRLLFEGLYLSEFDVAGDGRRFLMTSSALGTWPTRLRVVVDWFAELP